MIFFAKRLLLCSVVFLMSDFSFVSRLGILTGIQGLSFLIIIVQRPFTHFKDLLIEIVNEMCFLALIVLLFRFNKKEWSTSAKYLYIGLIFLNFTFIFVFSTGKLTKITVLVSLIISIWKKYLGVKKGKVHNQSSVLTERSIQNKMENSNRSEFTEKDTSKMTKGNSFILII